MNLLDRALLVAAPGLAYRRLRYRVAIESLEQHHKTRKYDAASDSRRTASWKKVSTSGNAETLNQAAKIRNRARDAVQNNAWAARAISAIEGNVVGSGISIRIKGTDPKAQQAAAKWKTWAETTACDFDGANDFFGLQALALRTAARDGMALLRKRRVPGLPIPMQLQVLESDMLDTTRGSGDNGNRVIQGVEVDDDGRVVAYWLYRYHPGDSGWFGRWLASRSSERVEASEVQRVYWQDRAGQLIGVSALAPVMVPLRDLDEYEDAQLIRQKIAACFAVFVRDATGADTTLAEDTDTSAEALIEKIEPGMFEHLPPGRDVSFVNPPTTEGFDVFVRWYLRKIAAGVGLSFEALSGDYSQVNFSSGRMGRLEMNRTIDRWQWHVVIPQFCVTAWRWFTEAASLAGPDIQGVEAGWTPPRREMIDPTKEIAAKRDGIRSGLTSWSETAREEGRDPAELAQELAADKALFEKYGLILDCDPSKVTKQGQAVEKLAEDRDEPIAA